MRKHAMWSRFRLFLVAVVGIVTVLVSTRSEAGWEYNFANCSKQSDGSGSCGGTFKGFRYNSDPLADAEFHMDSWPNGETSYWFQAYLNSVPYSCQATTSDVFSLWPSAMSARGEFGVYWDASGRCSFLRITNVSWTSY
jgi:hypothetical protein